MNLELVQWNFGNFGRHSGYHAFSRHLAGFDAHTGELDHRRWWNVPAALRHARGRLDARTLARVEDTLAPPAAPDVVHYLYAEWSLWIERLRAAHHARRPHVVATFHMPPRQLAKLPLARMLALVDHAIAMTRTQVDILRAHGARRVTVIPHGIDTAFFRPAPRPPAGPFRLLCVGTAYRDMPALLRLAVALQDRSDLVLDVVTSAATGARTRANIAFHRRVSDAELRRLYQRAGALVLPLRDATANNALLEAMACATPVIVTDHPAVREYVPSRAATFVTANRVATLVAAVDALATRPRRHNLAGRRRAEALAHPRVAEAHAAVYRQHPDIAREAGVVVRPGARP